MTLRRAPLVAACLAALLLWIGAETAVAQTVPDLELDNPRFQTVRWQDGSEVLLTVMPGTGATVMFERGEAIERVSLTRGAGFTARVSPEGNSVLVLADEGASASSMTVETDRRRYPFTLRTGDGLTAAYLLRFLYDASSAGPVEVFAGPEVAEAWSYRLRGDEAVLPQAVRDDSRRTYITYHAEQALPAVFAIGQTGEEEMVNGHMRGDEFVIDRVYAELVFRLDGERARARRNARPDAANTGEGQQ